MTPSDNLHSTAVAWLKVALPLIALGILSTLFLVARTVDPDAAIPYSQVDIADRVREPRLTTPTWAGMTDDGSAMTVIADEARPGTDGTSGASAQALRATMEMPDGGRAELVGDQGRVDTEGRQMTVAGNVVVSTSSGYRVETAELVAQLDRTGLSSPGDVAATGPMGKLTAGSMVMTGAEGRPGAYVLVFNGGVRLVYDPKSIPRWSARP